MRSLKYNPLLRLSIVVGVVQAIAIVLELFVVSPQNVNYIRMFLPTIIILALIALLCFVVGFLMIFVLDIDSIITNHKETEK